MILCRALSYEENTLDKSLLSNIKKKIRTVSPKHKYIVSVHGIGYKFEAE